MTAPLVSLLGPEDIRAICREQADAERPLLARAVVDLLRAELDRDEDDDPPPGDAGLIPIREVARRTGLHPRSIRRAILSDDFPPGIPLGRNGRGLRWRPSDVAAFIASRQP